MSIERLPITGDGTHILITADDGSKHHFYVWEDHGDDCANGIALAVERVKERTAKSHG